MGFVIGSNEGVLYIRGEYPKSIEAINGCINELKKLNLLGENILGTDFSFDLGICIGQGAYICGEETALIASIEGRRAEVDVRPCLLYTSPSPRDIVGSRMPSSA